MRPYAKSWMPLLPREAAASSRLPRWPAKTRVESDMALLIKYTRTAGAARRKRSFSSIQVAVRSRRSQGNCKSDSTFSSSELDSKVLPVDELRCMDSRIGVCSWSSCEPITHFFRQRRRLGWWWTSVSEVVSGGDHRNIKNSIGEVHLQVLFSLLPFSNSLFVSFPLCVKPLYLTFVRWQNFFFPPNGLYCGKFHADGAMNTKP